jgi:REP element-mobilizing transposase RayT
MLPRRILPGQRYLLTRRCSQRSFRLRPSRATNQIFRFLIAWAAQKTEVQIHAVVVMSNHIHLVVTDVAGRLPDFTRELHRMTAKAMNALQGQWECLWSPEPAHYLELGDDDDVIRKIAYVVANPVAAGLVERSRDWPGVLLCAVDEPVAEHVERPTSYFAEAGEFSRSIVLRVVSPAGIPDFAIRLRSELARLRDAAHAEMRTRGISFLGRQRVLGASFERKAKRHERRCGITPRVAAKNLFLRRAMLAAHTQFVVAYSAALTRWRTGLREIEFPVGTWLMRVVHGVRVALSSVAPESTRVAAPA